MLRFPTLGGIAVSTDIPSNKLIFRERKTWGTFFIHHNFQDGDCIIFEKISDYDYNVCPASA